MMYTIKAKPYFEKLNMPASWMSYLEQLQTIDADKAGAWFSANAIPLGFGAGIGFLAGVVAMLSLRQHVATSAPSSSDTVERSTPDLVVATDANSNAQLDTTVFSEQSSGTSNPMLAQQSPDAAQIPVTFPADVTKIRRDLVTFCRLLGEQPITQALLQRYVMNRYEPMRAIDAAALVALLIQKLVVLQQLQLVDGTTDTWQWHAPMAGSAGLGSSSSSSLISSQTAVDADAARVYGYTVDAAITTLIQLAKEKHAAEFYPHAKTVLAALIPSSADMTLVRQFALAECLQAWAKVALLANLPEQASDAKHWLEQALPVFKQYYRSEDHIALVPVLQDLAQAYGQLGEVNQQKTQLKVAVSISDAYSCSDSMAHTRLLADAILPPYFEGKKTLLENAGYTSERFYNGLSHPLTSFLVARLITVEHALNIGNNQSSRIIQADELLQQTHFPDETAEISRATQAIAAARQQLGLSAATSTTSLSCSSAHFQSVPTSPSTVNSPDRSLNSASSLTSTGPDSPFSSPSS